MSRRRRLSSEARLLLRLMGLLRGEWRWLLGGVAAALLALLASVGLLAVAGGFIAAMALAGATASAIDYFTPAALIRALALARSGARYAERVLAHDATLRVLARLRVWLYRAVEPLAPARLDFLRSADLLSRLQADVDTLNQFSLRVLLPGTVAALGVAMLLSLLAGFGMPLALACACWFALAGLVLPAWAWRSTRRDACEALRLRNRLRVAIGDALAGALELRAFGAEPQAARQVDELGRKLLRHQRRVADARALAGAAGALCGGLALCSALALLLPEVAARAMPAQRLPMLALLVLAGFDAVAPLPAAFALLGEVLAAARRVFALADLPPAVPAACRPAPPPQRCALLLRGLRMRYASDAPWVLDGLDLELRPGRRLALLGPSGCGKSSLLQVLTRLRDYEQGSVRLGGRELRTMRGDDLRERFAVLSQHEGLFHGSVRDNLLLARPDASSARLEAACRVARLHDEIAAFPAGYDTALGEGGLLLSGGQARRLALARAWLKDAPILLLDEPAEALDAGTEQTLYEALADAMQGRSVLLVTHRLGALASLLDEVALLECGRIAWRGPLACAPCGA